MSGEVKNFGTLFTETWERYKARALTILGVLFLSSLVIIAGVALVAGIAALMPGDMQAMIEKVQQGQFNGSIWLLLALFFLVVMVLTLWSQSATLAVVVDDHMGMGEAFRVGWQRMWSMGWILFLSGSIILAGFMLCLLPGILFSVSLMFALYPLYEDNIRGMDAVQASRFYVKGRWWNTFGKLLLIWLLAIVLDLIPVIGQLVSFLFTPFLLLFLVGMYHDLKTTAVDSPDNGHRTGMWLLAIFGMILPLAGLIFTLSSLGPQLPSLMQQIKGADEKEKRQILQTVKVVEHDEPSNENATVTEGDDVEGEGLWRWRDPVGDVDAVGIGRWLDIQAVSVQTEKEELLVTLQMQAPLTAAFNAASTTAQSIYRLAVLYFDTDVNRQTGGESGADGGRSGYDFGLDVTLEAPRNMPEQGQVHVGLFRLENNGRKFLGPLEGSSLHISGKMILIRVPYAVLQVHTGTRLRMSFLENFQKQGSGLAKDKLIDL